MSPYEKRLWASFLSTFQYVFADSNNIYHLDAKKEKENNDLSQPNKQKLPAHAQKAKIHMRDKLHEPNKKGLLNICQKSGLWTIKCHTKKEKCIAVNTKKTRMNPKCFMTVKRFARCTYWVATVG